MLENIQFSLGFVAMSVCLALGVWALLFNWRQMVRRLKGRGESVSPVFFVALFCLFLTSVICDACFPGASWSKYVLLVLAVVDLIAEVFHLLYRGSGKTTDKSELNMKNSGEHT